MKQKIPVTVGKKTMVVDLQKLLIIDPEDLSAELCTQASKSAQWAASYIQAKSVLQGLEIELNDKRQNLTIEERDKDREALNRSLDKQSKLLQDANSFEMISKGFGKGEEEAKAEMKEKATNCKVQAKQLEKVKLATVDDIKARVEINEDVVSLKDRMRKATKNLGYVGVVRSAFDQRAGMLQALAGIRKAESYTDRT